MRYAENHKETTHKKIVEQASQEFRQHGFDGVGIASLMSKLGLSHGGFYAHFADKEDLKDQAMEFAMDHNLEMASDILETGGILGYIEYYTSELHRDHPQVGCILATLCPEEGRRSEESKAKFTAKYHDKLELFAAYLPGGNVAENRNRASFILAALSGSMALARATGDPVASAAILRSTREQLAVYLASL